MKKLTVAVAAALLVLAAAAAFAQETPPVLLQSTGRIDADGIISPDEYSLSIPLPRARLALRWSQETLCIGITAPTAGWVAVGLGSRKMDGALIVIGYAKGSLAQLKIQKGSGHGHGDTPSEAMLAYAVTEKGATTTMELVLRASSVIGESQTGLDMIAAFGGSDSFSGLHRWRAPLAVALGR